jgi:hypothetical protein
MPRKFLPSRQSKSADLRLHNAGFDLPESHGRNKADVTL